MNIKLPDAAQIVDKFLLGFFAAFGFFFATWINAKIPWPSM